MSVLPDTMVPPPSKQVPHFITMYRLEELTTQRELTGVIAGMFRSNATVKDQRAVDLLVIKGQEELHLITAMHKQRHHLITEYVHAPRTAAAAAEEARKSPMSPFLQAFYKNN